MRRLTAGLAAVLVAAAVTVAAPSAAFATKEQCAGGANGFADIPDNLVGVTVDQRSNSVTNLHLMFGQVNGQNRGWALLGSAPGTRFGGDSYLVWMDWSINGGYSWMQCGPFNSRAGLATITSAAKDTHPTYSFRAGALVNGELLLTGWH
ncbi:hypothetical protein [Nocardia sp. NRRL S-836]|uniref:hypothetical protein n=1 Tax=Nocardia sp. NRRL S-836 TaxID=1519492 RepID=UPI0006AF84BC|nr:hypothetical protein [Nocardia sp. NRRL S-836]